MLDGSIRMQDLCRRVSELEMPAIALTDHGNMFGALDFQEQAQKKKIKPIFGCEFYLSPRGMNDRSNRLRYHLVALAENQTGYHNLCKLSSASFIEGFYYKPRIDKELLADHSEGLIISGACLQGEVPYLLARDKMAEAREAAGQYVEIAGKGNFYLELMDHGLPEQKKVNVELVRLAREMNIPLIATNDVHYMGKDDYEASQILTCIGTDKKVNDPDRFVLNSDQYYLKTAEEMEQIFGVMGRLGRKDLECALTTAADKDVVMPTAQYICDRIENVFLAKDESRSPD